MKSHLFLGGLLILAAGCTHRPTIAKPDNGFYAFANKSDAIRNGETIRTAVISTDNKVHATATALIGQTAAFSGVDVTGANEDLLLDGVISDLPHFYNGFSGDNGPKIILHVQLDPNHDVRPHATTWTAEVLGTVTAIDFEKHVITITAHPYDWRVTETW
jgi:hypothetical protein